MTDLFFGGNAGPFTATALIGTLFFVGRLVLMLMGGADWSVDADVDVDVDVADGDVHGHDSSEAFKVLSIQSIAAFFMGFGWGGLGALKGAGWPVVVSGAFGVAAGLAMVWLLGKLLGMLRGLDVAGNVDISQALLTEGTIYTEVPPHGQGKGRVKLIIDDRVRYYQAVSEDDSAIASRTKVRVTSVNDDNTVTVTRL